MSDELHMQFIWLGNPIPWQSTKKGKYGFYKPQTIVDYQEDIAWKAKQAMNGHDPFDGYLAIEVFFYRQYKHRVDNDNLLKPVSDAMSGIVYGDDTQILRTHIERRFCNRQPGIRVHVWQIKIDPEVDKWIVGRCT
jgi:Holliday junction resolvase RusA-like endonuclease